MAKIYFVRHQAHGVVWEYPFAIHPTQEQVAAVAKFCFNHHGFGHAKTPERPYWTRVEEVTVVESGQIPDVPDRVLGVAGEPGAARAELSRSGVSGVGTITTKGG
jgi:hypothetical protein